MNALSNLWLVTDDSGKLVGFHCTRKGVKRVLRYHGPGVFNLTPPHSNHSYPVTVLFNGDFEMGLNTRKFPDNCEVCHGEKGGMRGNENVVDGVVMCDYCHYEHTKS